MPVSGNGRAPCACTCARSHKVLRHVIPTERRVTPTERRVTPTDHCSWAACDPY
jgi:hypothetical protein